MSIEINEDDVVKYFNSTVIKFGNAFCFTGRNISINRPVFIFRVFYIHEDYNTDSFYTENE